jgi:hypothetical protein
MREMWRRCCVGDVLTSEEREVVTNATYEASEVDAPKLVKIISRLCAEVEREREGRHKVEKAWMHGKWPLGVEPPEASKEETL